MAESILVSESSNGEIPALDSLSKTTITPINSFLSKNGAIKAYLELVLTKKGSFATSTANGFRI